MSESLIKIDRKELSISFSADVKAQKCSAIMAAQDIEEVINAEQQASAVAVQQSLSELRRVVEEQRKEVKAPFINFGRTLDETVKEFLAKVVAEENRIAALNGEFQQLLIAKQKAAETARLKELNENERLCQERLAQSKDLNEHQAIREEHAQVAAQMAPIAPRPVVKGQIVKDDIEFEVEDKRALYLSFPNLIELEPKRREIKEALMEGINLPGVKWRRVVKSQTRGKAQQVLEV